MDATTLLPLLRGETSAPRHALAELLLEQLLAAPLNDYVELDTLPQLVHQALSRDNVARAVDRHVLPGFRRVCAELDAAGETVGDALPPSSQDAIRAMAVNPNGPRFAWLRGAVSVEALGGLVGPVVQEVLMQFAQNLPLAGGKPGRGGTAGGGTRGLVGRLSREVGRSTGKLMDVGRSVADGLGVDVEGRIKEAARDYSKGATSVVQRAMRELLKEPQGRAAVERIAGEVTAHVMAASVGDIVKDLDRLPLDSAFGLAPEVIEHNVTRERVQGLIASELQAYFESQGERSIGELLQEYAVEQPVRAWALRRVDTQARSLFESDAFASWLQELLAAGG